VVGVDNDEVICELTDPPLSSVDQGPIGWLPGCAVLDQMMSGRRVAGATLHRSRVRAQSPLDRRAGH